MTHALDGACRPIWTVYVLVPLAAGLDKFTNLLVDWERYIARVALRLLRVDGQTFMYIVGIVEIAVGVLALTRFRRLAAYVTAAWLVLISFNLLAAAYYDEAVRDLAMALGDESQQLYTFDGARCDRIVNTVLQRIGAASV